MGHEFVQLDKVRGEKQWQQWAQDLEDFSIKQTNVANTRLPYASTLQLNNLVQVDEQADKVRGEKQWQAWAQDLEDFGIKQTTKANTRLPYASTLQLDEQGSIARKVRGEKQWQAWAQDLEDFSIKQTNVANTRLPYKSTLTQLNEEGPAVGADKTGKPSDKVRGEKQWQPNADTMQAYGDHSTTKANTRLPYASTLQMNQLVQTRDDDDESDDDDIQIGVAGEKVADNKVPLDFHFLHLAFDDGELVKIEDNKGIPLDFRF